RLSVRPGEGPQPFMQTTPSVDPVGLCLDHANACACEDLLRADPRLLVRRPGVDSADRIGNSLRAAVRRFGQPDDLLRLLLVRYPGRIVLPIADRPAVRAYGIPLA